MHSQQFVSPFKKMSFSIPLARERNCCSYYSITFYTNAELYYEHAIPFLTQKLAENNALLGVSRSCVLTPQRYPERFLMIIRRQEEELEQMRSDHHSSEELRNGMDQTMKRVPSCSISTDTGPIAMVMIWTLPYRLLLSAPSLDQTLQERHFILSAWMDLFLNIGNAQEKMKLYCRESCEEIEHLMKKYGRAVNGVMTDNLEAEWFAKEYGEKLKNVVENFGNEPNIEIFKLRVYSLKANDIRPCRDLEKQQERYVFSYLDLNNAKQLEIYIQFLDQFMTEIFPNQKKKSKEDYLENIIKGVLKNGFATLCYEKGDDQEKTPICIALVTGIPKAGRYVASVPCLSFKKCFFIRR